MNTNLVSIAEIGMSLLTLGSMIVLVRILKSGIDQTSWETSRKKKVYRTIVISLYAWFAFTAVWSISGMMSDFSKFPFNFMPVIAVPLISMIVLVTRSNQLAEILSFASPIAIARLQVFRVFVEVLLWMLFVANAIPVQMTFEGFNFDVLSGLTAPIVAWLIMRNKISRSGVIIWNIACLALLANIVTIAILSTPSPVRVFMNEPANLIVTTFPMVLLPGFLVPLAFTLSFFSIKQMTLRASHVSLKATKAH